MSKPGLSFGLNLTKKAGASKPAPAKRNPIFGGDDGSDDDTSRTKGQAEEIAELDDFPTSSPRIDRASRKSKVQNAPPSHPPTRNAKKPESAMFGDISSSLTSRKYAEAAQELDSNIYDYDAVYDSLKPQKKTTQEDVERKPRYMSSLLAAASVRKRDALIAEEKKIAREREAEGDEFAEKEKFVTEAYKKQQEENKRIEEEERRREEVESKMNKAGGMTAFYKDLLNRGDQRHADVVKAVEERAKAGPPVGDTQQEEERTEADIAKEINEKGGSVAVNEEGQVVDKRELLRGGLNVGAKKEAQVRKEASRARDDKSDRGPGKGFLGAGGKGAMRDRQTRMMEEQLEQALKRSREEEDQEREKVELAAKTKKTDTDISSAKERYLARKREAEEAKKKGLAA